MQLLKLRNKSEQMDIRRYHAGLMACPHEYQRKRLLQEAGVAIFRSKVARTSDEVFAIAQDLGGKVVDCDIAKNLKVNKGD